MILTSIIVVYAPTIVLSQKIEKSQVFAMFVVRMIMVCIKMRKQCW